MYCRHLEKVKLLRSKYFKADKKWFNGLLESNPVIKALGKVTMIPQTRLKITKTMLKL